MEIPGGAAVKIPPAMQEIGVPSLSWDDHLEQERATHSSVLAWEIPWTEEPGRLQSLGSQKELDRTQRLNHHHHASIYSHRNICIERHTTSLRFCVVAVLLETSKFILTIPSVSFGRRQWHPTPVLFYLRCQQFASWFLQCQSCRILSLKHGVMLLVCVCVYLFIYKYLLFIYMYFNQRTPFTSYQDSYCSLQKVGSSVQLRKNPPLELKRKRYSIIDY